MSETKREYASNYRKPPLRTRFKKADPATPRATQEKPADADRYDEGLREEGRGAPAVV